MNLQEVFEFMNRERLAVLSTTTNTGQPEAALMGFAVTNGLEIVFDTIRSSRKYQNLIENPRTAWVIGCSSEVTVQYEGIAEELAGEPLQKYKPIYFAKFPDGKSRESWKGIVHFLVRPKWIRYCDYNPANRRIEEQTF